MRRLALALVLLVCCSKKSNDDPGELPEDADGGFGSTSSSSGGISKDGGVTPLPECSDDTKDVFVISKENSLYRFHPPTLEFTNLGLLHCPTSGAVPDSMAVDRNGIAWIRHSDGSIWKVSTKDLACEGTNFVPPQTEDGSFQKFGMGFSTSSKGGSAEELFISDHNTTGMSDGLARINTTTLAVTFIGPYDGALAGTTSELTGTSDGKLYGLFVTSPMTIGEISKGTGAVTNTKVLDNTYPGEAWAFSQYGGDFYVYTFSLGKGGGPPLASGGSDVTRYRPSTNEVGIVKNKIGFEIVGAGVSTCAPTTQVR